MEFSLPPLSDGVEEGRLVRWTVRTGDHVATGDVVCIFETRAGTVDVAIRQPGIVTELVAEPGQTLAVGGLLARVARDAGTASMAASLPEAPESPGGSPDATPAEAGIPSWKRISPAARKRAGELGIDLARVDGTGAGAAITLGDVEREAGLMPQHPEPPSPMETTRAAISAAMVHSKREIPHYYLGQEIRIDRAMAWLESHNAREGLSRHIVFPALALKAVAVALRESPHLNGHFIDNAFRQAPGIHVGVAFALREGGIVAPAIRDADRLGLPALMARLRDLLSRAREGQLRSSELASPTITVTQFGEIGVQTVYGVIVPPQVAVVGLGKAMLRPWVDDGRIVPAQVLHATLSADLRVSDGRHGARFLNTLDELLQAPDSLA